MSKTIFVDCNRLNSIDKDSNNNAEWTYNLKESISLPAGSSIQIQNSFLNQKGILGSSIEIEEDIEEIISYYVYITEELKLMPAMTQESEVSWSDCLYTLGDNQLYNAPINTGTISYIANRFNMGGSQSPMILYNKIVISGNNHIVPQVQEKSIFIKKGIYGINQLAQLITDQINGKKTLNNVPTNPLDHLLSDKGYRGNMCKTGSDVINVDGGAGLTAVVAQYQRFGEMDSVAKFLAEFNALIYNYVFIDPYTHEFNLMEVKESPLTKDIPMPWYGASSTINNCCCGLLVDNRIEAPPHQTIKGDKKKTQAQFQADIDDYQLGYKGYTAGAKNFNISYDSLSNGFTINNLHEDYQIPSHDLLGFPNTNAGSVAVGFRNPAQLNENLTSIFADDGNDSKSHLYSALRKPVSRQGGSIIFNFGTGTARRIGDKDISEYEEFLVNNLTFADYFTNEASARVGWKKTLWSRLGFSYDQLNSPKHMEEIMSFNKSYKGELPPANIINRDIMKDGLKMTGITTDAEIDISIIPTISTLTNPNVVAGTATRPEYSGVKVFSGIGSNSPRRLMAGIQGTNDNIASYRGSPYFASTMDLAITRPKPIIAETLPTLSQFGYYLISSNVVSENDDIVQKGSPLPLLGVVPKSSLSSQDFISSENDIVHITTNPKVINNIKINVFNPDLTQPILDGASSIILKITMPIEVPVKSK